MHRYFSVNKNLIIQTSRVWLTERIQFSAFRLSGFSAFRLFGFSAFRLFSALRSSSSLQLVMNLTRMKNEL